MASCLLSYAGRQFSTSILKQSALLVFYTVKHFAFVQIHFFNSKWITPLRWSAHINNRKPIWTNMFTFPASLYSNWFFVHIFLFNGYLLGGGGKGIHLTTSGK